MKIKHKKTLYIFTLLICAGFSYFIWLSVRPVDIVAVHEYRHSSDVLVKSFPVTDKGKINWWLKNKNMLKEKYGIPKPESDGYFTMYFWLFGDGYKEEGKYDRLCFDDMPPPVNCIEKDAVFNVINSRDGRVFFTVYNGTYQLKSNGEIVKLKSY